MKVYCLSGAISAVLFNAMIKIDPAGLSPKDTLVIHICTGFTLYFKNLAIETYDVVHFRDVSNSTNIFLSNSNKDATQIICDEPFAQ